ncbi:hypothetical protein CAOG_00769 [Capsaspora owczarzaki ATCC 30864]|uniref:hypothetical protein n=1 Tax=Capsaspora owczarzaki (strain ATCC 30864) TaxID=595528 RepID=UPI00035237F9|nr:hypothetical protein CAOG_00769 [Capsaspora owczarzaki ATCC 30864]|eukprot:XP_004365640.2 hypothetical protein CAOG_00769 [Capsaspora owczarzaki ATCC 30864]
MDPIRHEAVERDNLTPLLLATLTNHEGAISCVRWAPTGNMLASAGDDKTIVIWQLSSDKTFGGLVMSNLEGDVNIEYWRYTKALKAHLGDVTDLAWAPHGRQFASCSLDGVICIWDTTNFTLAHKLEYHTGPVKGIAWDPVGEFFASQSGDNTVAVWQTRDWEVVRAIQKPFEQAKDTLFFRRLSWSADGSFLAATHAYNANKASPVCALIERNSWACTRDLVGHDAPVQVARFSPFMFVSPDVKDPNQRLAEAQNICALGSQDCAVSVWKSPNVRALVVAKFVHSDSVTDMCWGDSGYELITASLDGTVCYMKFSREELGEPLSRSEMALKLRTLHGEVIDDNAEPFFIAETPEQLSLYEQQQRERAAIPMDTSVVPVHNLPQKPIAASKLLASAPQAESFAKDGRRRIQPQLLVASTDEAEAPQTALAQVRQPAAVVPRRVGPGNGLTAVPKTLGMASSSAQSAASSSSQPPPSSRAAPLAAQPVQRNRPAFAVPKGMPATTPAAAAPLVPAAKPPVRVNPMGSAATTSTSVAGPMTATATTSTSRAPVSRGAGSQPESLQTKEQTTRVQSTLLLSAPELLTSVQIFSNHSNQVISVSADERKIPVGDSTHIKLAYITAVPNSESGPRWHTVLNSPVQYLACSSNFVVALCKDGEIHVFSILGRRILPAVRIPSGVHFLAIHNEELIVLSRDKHLYIWNLESLVCTVHAEPFSSVFDQLEAHVIAKYQVEATITVTGVIVLLVPAAYQCYAFDPSLRAWLLVVDNANRLFACSAHSSHLPSTLPALESSSTRSRYALPNSLALAVKQVAEQNAAVGPLKSLQHSIGPGPLSTAQVMSSALGGDPDLQCAATVAYLEHQIAASVALLSVYEYQYWMTTLITFLADAGLTIRLGAMMESLIPAHEENRDQRLARMLEPADHYRLVEALLARLSSLPGCSKLATSLLERLRAGGEAMAQLARPHY